MSTMSIYLICALLLLIASYTVLRVLFRRDYLHKGQLNSFSILAGWVIFFLWGGFHYTYGIPGWPAVRVGAIQQVTGWVCLWGGLALLFSAMFYLGLLRSHGRDGSELKCTGPYRFSRNPQVLGCILYGIGFVLLWPSWYALGWLLILGAILHIMVTTEEEHLQNRFGQEYERYCSQVPRYLGITKRK